MADLEGKPTGNGRGTAIGWGVAAGLLVMILVIVFLILGTRVGRGPEQPEIDVDVRRTEVEVPKTPEVEINVPEKVEIEIKTPPPQKTGTQ